MEHLWETVKMEEVERVHKSSHITQHVEHIVSKAFMQTEKNLEKRRSHCNVSIQSTLQKVGCSHFH